MRDLHLSKVDIDNLSYAQVYVLMKCIKEANKAVKDRESAQKAMDQLKIRPR